MPGLGRPLWVWGTAILVGMAEGSWAQAPGTPEEGRIALHQAAELPSELRLLSVHVHGRWRERKWMGLLLASPDPQRPDRVPQGC